MQLVRIPRPTMTAAMNTAAPLALITTITATTTQSQTTAGLSHCHHRNDGDSPHPCDGGTSGPSSTSNPPPAGCRGGAPGPDESDDVLCGVAPGTGGGGTDENGLGGRGGCCTPGTGAVLVGLPGPAAGGLVNDGAA